MLWFSSSLLRKPPPPTTPHSTVKGVIKWVIGEKTAFLSILDGKSILGYVLFPYIHSSLNHSFPHRVCQNKHSQRLKTQIAPDLSFSIPHHSGGSHAVILMVITHLYWFMSTCVVQAFHLTVNYLHSDSPWCCFTSAHGLLWAPVGSWQEGRPHHLCAAFPVRLLLY